MNRIDGAAAALFLVSAGLLTAAPPQPTPPTGQTQPRPPGAVVPAPTGYDLAVVWFSSTGPQGVPCANTPAVVIENKGSRAIDQLLAPEVSASSGGDGGEGVVPAAYS